MDEKTKNNLTTAAVVAGGALAGYALVKTIKVEAGEEDKPDKPKYNLNVLVNPSNSGTVIPPSGSFVAGSTVTLKATPKTGYRFSNWTGATGGATTTIVMNSNKTITANFELIPSGKLETVYIDKAPEGNNLILPQTVNADGNSFELGLKAVNNGLQNYNARIRIRVYNPQNNLVYENPVEWIALPPNGIYNFKDNITWVGMAGQWRITVAMIEQSTEMILASYTGIMTAINEEEPPIYGEVTNVRIISPSSPITIKKGEPVVFEIEYMYGGSLSSAVLEAKIGHQYYGIGARWGETVCKNTKTETLEASSGITPRTTTITVPTTTIREDEVYDIMCRIGTAESPVLDDIIDVKSEVISLDNFFIESYTPEVTAGENLSVTVSMDYQGPSTTKEVYVALGHKNYIRVLWWDTGWFDEKIAGSAIADLPNSPDKTTTVKKVLLLNTRDVTPGDYDLYAKIIPTKRNEDFTPVIDDRVTITGTTYEDLRLVSYPDLVEVGGNCYIKFEFKYTGPSTTINTHCALWQYAWFGLDHDEVSAQDTIQFLPASNGEYRPLYFNVPIHSGMEGKTYGIYMKIVGIPGPDIYSTYYEDKVTVLGTSNLSLTIQDVNVPCYSDLVFSIDGFGANETVAISVVETGGGFNVQANSNGGGYWAFRVTDAPGRYTLRATNSSGIYVEEWYHVYAPHPGYDYT